MLRRFASTLLLATLAIAPSGMAQNESASTSRTDPETEVSTAPVAIDARTLFHVRGVSAYPPEKRATGIEARILAIAADERFAAQRIQVVEAEHSTDIMADQLRLVSVFDADASIEGMDRRTLAVAYAERIRMAIEDYRRHRSPEYLRTAALHAVGATAIFVAALWPIIWLMRRLSAVAETRYKQRVRSVAIQSFQILRAQQIWSAVQGSLRTLRLVSIAILAYLYVQFVLGQFPWTRPIAQRLLHYLVDPLVTMGRAMLANLPDLVFLAVLIIVARYVLRLLRLFFEAIGRGTVKLQNFEPDWAAPTYRLVRLGVIVFTAIVAYPYIPGSGSEAFKGISIFLGVIFSIGSSSFVSNTIAGYALTYRRVFKIGDRVKIEDVVGDVVQTRLQVTHLCSLKNEEVIVPNSLIVNSQVVNYSSLARKQGLILHTTVGIGYETPWRKVEAMLLLAADRTPGLLREPKSFVLLKTLGDFSITYELNACCDDAQAMVGLYSALHRNILDVFNEHAVQIMTPAYECDPEQPKIVPKEQWFVAPATANPA
jgi:small-conductance mechanosensitive channel